LLAKLKGFYGDRFPLKILLPRFEIAPNYIESLKTALLGGFFVSGQEITPDPADPSIPLLIRSANLHPVDVRQQPKIAGLQFLERKSTS
jgi:hypothetical protein